MYLQTVTLPLRAKGLHGFPQKAWSIYHRTVRGVVGGAENPVLCCGPSIGFEGPAVPATRVDRAPLARRSPSSPATGGRRTTRPRLIRLGLV